MTEDEIPANLAAAAATAREQLIEMVAEADETLMETFFAEGTLSQEQLVAGLRIGDDGRPAVPAGLHVRHCRHRHPAAARRHRQLRAVAGRSRLPGDCRRRSESPIAASAAAPYAAFVWKTIADPFAGRITMLRVVSGTLKSDATVHNDTRDAGERLGHLLVLQGKAQTHVAELRAGDLGAVAKLKDTHTNDVLADKSTR